MIPRDLPFDLARIGEVLEQHAVRYVVIGGMSGTFHGMVEYRTKDIDLLVQHTTENLACLAAALTELRAVPLGTNDDRLIVGADLGAASTQWDTDAGPIDVLVTAAWSNDSIVIYSDIVRGSVVFDLGSGVAMPVASLDDLIRMKEVWWDDATQGTRFEYREIPAAMAEEVRALVARVLKAAVREELRPMGDPASVEAIVAVLGKPVKKRGRIRGPMKALKGEKMPEFMVELRAIKSQSARALEALILSTQAGPISSREDFLDVLLDKGAPLI